MDGCQFLLLGLAEVESATVSTPDIKSLATLLLDADGERFTGQQLIYRLGAFVLFFLSVGLASKAQLCPEETPSSPYQDLLFTAASTQLRKSKFDIWP